MRLLAARLIGLTGVEKLILNPHRAGRSQLRMIRRIRDRYLWLRNPRRDAEAEIARNQVEIG